MMIRDFRKRFYVTLVLTIPVLALAPIIQGFLGFSFSYPGSNYIVFGLASVIYFYGGRPFLSGIILVNSNPLDITALILFGRATHRKMVQNLIWATGYTVVAIPLAAGVLYNAGVLLSPEGGGEPIGGELRERLERVVQSLS